MNRLIIICLLALLSGCDRPTDPAELRADMAKIASEIVYFKEPRTGLCFAYYWSFAANGGPALAAVECKVVEKFIN